MKYHIDYIGRLRDTPERNPSDFVQVQANSQEELADLVVKYLYTFVNAQGMVVKAKPGTSDPNRILIPMHMLSEIYTEIKPLGDIPNEKAVSN